MRRGQGGSRDDLSRELVPSRRSLGTLAGVAGLAAAFAVGSLWLGGTALELRAAVPAAAPAGAPAAPGPAEALRAELAGLAGRGSLAEHLAAGRGREEADRGPAEQLAPAPALAGRQGGGDRVAAVQATVAAGTDGGGPKPARPAGTGGLGAPAAAGEAGDGAPRKKKKKAGGQKTKQAYVSPGLAYRVVEPRENATSCGATLQEEPWIRTITEPGARCQCLTRADKDCQKLDYPNESYLFGHVASEPRLRALLTTVKMEASPAHETIVHSAGADQLGLDGYLAAMKPAKGGRKAWSAVMDNSFLVFTEAGRTADDMQNAMARMATGQKVSFTGGGGGGELGELQPRKVAIEASDTCTEDQDIEVSFIIQYFRRPAQIAGIVSRLRSYPGRNEILVNNDSASEVPKWLAALNKKGPGPIRYNLVVSGDIHEIRGYNRLAKLSRGELIVFMQDDDLPSPRPNWFNFAKSLFAKNPKLGLVGGFTGTIQGGPLTDKYGVEKKAIKYKTSFGNNKFMFVTLVNMGPFVTRSNFFLESGMFSANYSCRGEAGIGFDYEFSLRTW